MSCRYTDTENLDYLNRFRQKAAALRIPVSGSIDLTTRCNLQCVHCFLGSERKTPQPELPAKRWIEIIDDLTEAGCLYLLITGGEPLLHPDFAAIYTHAKQSGLMVTVFSNGTLIDDAKAGLFEDLPPQAFEISLYGASPGVFESITGRKGSYDQCISGIRRLLDHNVRVKLKTVLMTQNIDEFYDIEQMAAQFGVSFRMDAALFPCLDRDNTPLAFRVSPREAVIKELSDPDRFSQWKDYYERRLNHAPEAEPNLIYRCSAGRTNFHITSRGIVKPCLMSNSVSFDLLRQSFSSGWKDIMPQLAGRVAGNDFKCRGCEKIALCGYCPAFFELETGREDRHSDYLCRTAAYRYDAVVNARTCEPSAFYHIPKESPYGGRKQEKRI